MLKSIIILGLGCLFTYNCFAQITPKENAKLNHLITGFSVPKNSKAKAYHLQVAKGIHLDERKFTENIIISETSDDNRFIEELPSFAEHYTWRISYVAKKRKKNNPAELYHFATDVSPFVDTSRYRLRVISNNMAGSDLLLLTDTKGIIYNLEGKPVWFLPEINQSVENNALRDFKATKDGTFTILGDVGYEVDYDGNIVWKTPDNGKVSGDTSERFHHEFTKLDNGHYMVCGNEMIDVALPENFDTTFLEERDKIVHKNGMLYQKKHSGTLIEYDSAGNVIWTWRAANLLPDNILLPKMRRSPRMLPAPGMGAHMNSFYFDEQNKIIYISFRDLNTIVKISYPSGNAITSYGLYKNLDFTGKALDTPFYHQHTCHLNSKGELFLFNNNVDVNKRDTSWLMIFREPVTTSGELIKQWEFKCAIDNNTPPATTSGGSIYELPDGKLLSSMGALGRVFILDRSKKLFYNAVPETNNEYNQASILPQYRVNFIYKHDLKKFIFK